MHQNLICCIYLPSFKGKFLAIPIQFTKMPGKGILFWSTNNFLIRANDYGFYQNFKFRQFNKYSISNMMNDLALLYSKWYTNAEFIMDSIKLSIEHSNPKIAINFKALDKEHFYAHSHDTLRYNFYCTELDFR